MPRRLTAQSSGGGDAGVGLATTTEAVDGRAVGFASPLWLATTALYLAGFGCAGGVEDHRARGTEPVLERCRWAPHHRAGVWSLHEDFHLLMCLGDALNTAMAVRHLATAPR
jgi:hypothetical protein